MFAVLANTRHPHGSRDEAGDRARGRRTLVADIERMSALLMAVVEIIVVIRVSAHFLIILWVNDKRVADHFFQVCNDQS